LVGRSRRFLVPEVVQTSEMDCGPAALACLLRGLGISASYSRLREACQSDIDGTSVDTLEDVALACGVAAEQVIVPPDHVGVPEAGLVPGIVITRTDTGIPHFVVLWKIVGPLVQVMDPRVGRRWLRSRRFLQEVYRHEMLLPEEAWSRWARSEALTAPLERRLRKSGVARSRIDSLVNAAREAEGWRPIAELDAAARFITGLKRAGAVRGRRRIERVLGDLLAEPALIPDEFRFARPPDGAETGKVLVRGAIVLKAPGLERQPEPESLPPMLAEALSESPERPTRDLLGLLRARGSLRPVALAVVSLFSGAGVVGEGLLLWRLISGQGSVPVLLALVLLLLAVETAVVSGSVRMGRRLEGELRQTLDNLLPRLPDRYLSSRPTSDLAERAQRTHMLRQLPSLLAEILRSLGEIVALGVAITVLHPSNWVFALLSAISAAVLPFALQPLLSERDQRVRNHAGAMARLTLDTLLGLFAIRAHRAGARIARQHNDQLEFWDRAAAAGYRTVVVTDALQLVLGFGFATLMIANAGTGLDGSQRLLLAFWAVSLTLAGQTLGLAARQYPLQRNVALRLFEPIRAGNPERHGPTNLGDLQVPSSPGADIRLSGVSVVLAGQQVLSDVDLEIRAGEHVAVVGRSGAGKSTLAGLVLGWQSPATGDVVVDGTTLNSETLHEVRRFTAWVDPTVQLWNESLESNLAYGNWDASTLDRDEVLQRTGLDLVGANLPSPGAALGEGGGLVSGGEGQRVRLARALLRPGVRLVVLDEPLRGLDRAQRHDLLEYCRQVWKGATMLCITHDVAETMNFDRVVVIEAGRIVENGEPSRLAANPSSDYRLLLDGEKDVEKVWDAVAWRRLELHEGRLAERAASSFRQ
jgi:ABC-type bacteriocin/lantibiotic exporter with double-glycine peptidase domain